MERKTYKVITELKNRQSDRRTKKQSTVSDHGFKKSDKVKTELKNIQRDNGTKKTDKVTTELKKQTKLQCN